MEENGGIKRFMKRYYVREILCIVLLLASVFLSIVSFIDTSPAERTLSNIGEADPVWFFFWGLTTSTGVYLNLRLLAEKLQFKNKLFNVVAAIGSFAIMGTALIYGPLWWQVTIHWTCGMMFGILSFLCVFTLLIVRYMKTKKGKIIISLVILAAIADVAFIFAFGLTALCEITILIVCELVLLFVNFMQKTRPENVSIPEFETVEIQELKS